jgi:hypothetical protein
MELLLIFISLVLAFVGGALFGTAYWRPQVELYRKRWREANALLQADPDVKQRKILVKGETASEAKKGKHKPTPAHAQLTMRKIHGLTPSVRTEMEIERLKAGLPPRDDLQGLPPSRVADIERARLRAGWG